MQKKLDGIKAALMERMLRGEMTHHLGYKAGEEALADSANRRNGTSTKTLQADNGEVTINIPRDRFGDFDPIIVQKHQRRLPDFDEKVIALYARGLSTKDIQSYLYEIYKTEVSSELISIVMRILRCRPQHQVYHKPTGYTCRFWLIKFTVCRKTAGSGAVAGFQFRDITMKARRRTHL